MAQLGRVVVENHLVVAAAVAVGNNLVVVLGYKPVAVAPDCTLVVAQAAALVVVVLGYRLVVQVVDNLAALVPQGGCMQVPLELVPLVADELEVLQGLACR